MNDGELTPLSESQEIALQDPEWYYRKVLNYRPLNWQVEGTQAVIDVRRKAMGIPTIVNHEGKSRITIRSCHGTGKTQFIALVLHLWLFTTYGLVACTAPKQDQLLRRLLPRFRAAMNGAHKGYQEQIEVLGKTIKVGGDPDHGAVMETASDPDNLSGYHNEPQLFMVDEASGKRLEPMFPIVQGALTTAGSCLVEIGNPTRISGEFYRHHVDALLAKYYYRMHIKHTDAPTLISKEWIEYMDATYGVDSPIYKIRVLGEFASFDDYILLPWEYIERAMDVEKESDGSIPKLRITIDVADGGADKTMITAGLHYSNFIQILKQKAFNFNPSEAPIDAALAGIKMFEGFSGKKGSADDFVVDANGVGSGTAGTLIKKGYNVIRHVGSETGGCTLRNRRVQNAINLYGVFRDDKIFVAPDAIDDVEEFYSQLLSIKRASADKSDDIETKDKMKQDGLPSPDRFDSLSMQCYDTVSELEADNTPAETFGNMESANTW